MDEQIGDQSISEDEAEKQHWLRVMSTMRHYSYFAGRDMQVR